MKRTLPDPNVLVASRAIRPCSPMAVSWTAKTSAPALALATAECHWNPGRFIHTSTLSSAVSASFVSKLLRPASVSSMRMALRVPIPSGLVGSRTTGIRGSSGVWARLCWLPCEPGIKTNPLAWNSTNPRIIWHCSSVNCPFSVPTSPRKTTSYFESSSSEAGNSLM